MTSYMNRCLDYEIKALKTDREIYRKRLQSCNGLENIRMRKAGRNNGKHYYYTKHQDSKRYSYISSKNNPLIKQICEAHFLKEALRRIDSNISIVTQVLDQYAPYDSVSVNKSLPMAYRSDIYPIAPAYQCKGDAWMDDRLAFQTKFPENYPAYKNETASDGVKVKTLSELLLYERLKASGLYVIYELPLVLNDHGPVLYPDFTILSPVDMKTEIIVEYVGRLDLQQYRDKFAKKIGRYISNGYIPGVNLFFVFGNKEGHIDSLQINKVIADIRGL